MFKVICPFICVASTFKNSFWGETEQVLPVFKVICLFICVASKFKNSFWGETVQLLTVFKVICPFICVAKASAKYMQFVKIKPKESQYLQCGCCKLSSAHWFMILTYTMGSKANTNP